METIIAIKLEMISCCVCGIPFGLPDYFLQRLREKGNDFYCPNGHVQLFGQSEISKLQRKLADAEKHTDLFRNWYKAEQDDHLNTRRRLSATKGVLTRTKKRIANGVCPCCNRHFANVQRHIEDKHPDYKKEVMTSESIS